MGDEDKNFDASQQKLKKARDQGQVVKSKDLTTGLFVITMFFLLLALSGFIWNTVAETFIVIFDQISRRSIEDIGWQFLLLVSVRCLVFTVAPFMLVAFLVAIVAELIQVGILFTVEPLMPKFDKLNPINGFKNIFSKRSIIELIKNIIKVGFLALVAWSSVSGQIDKIIATASSENVMVILQVISEIITSFVYSAALAFFVIGGFDYLYQRNKFMGDQKMSLKEVKDEYKQSEGDPHVKQQLRQRRMQMAQQRQLEAVPTADVVTTNPIHVAVAIKYDPEKGEAPIVVAKGAELFAEQIKAIAKQHGVPIVENPTVARSLYKLVDMDREVPPDLFQAVAEILLFAWKQQGKEVPLSKKTPPPTPPELP
jgi:flagellar biosynthetic protein FlhB